LPISSLASSACAEVRAFACREVLEEPSHSSSAEGARWARRVDRVEPSLRQELRQRGSARCRLDADRVRKLELDLLDPPRVLEAAGDIRGVSDRQTVMLGEDAANPNVGGQLVLGDADAPAAELFGALDAAVTPHVDAGVAECPRREDRHGDERGFGASTRDHIRGQRELGDVELAEARHAEEDLLRLQGDVVDAEAFRPDASRGDRASAVVVPTGERDAHGGSIIRQEGRRRPGRVRGAFR
jgi:hypothetical protein